MTLASVAPRLVPSSLRWRLILTFVSVAVLVWLVFGIYLVRATRELYIDRLSDQLAAQARLVGEAVAPTLSAGGGIDQVDLFVKRLGSSDGERITVIAADGTVLGDTHANPRLMENHAGRPEVRAAFASGMGIEEHTSATLGVGFLYVAVPIPRAPDAVARVAMPLDTVNGDVRRVQRDVALATAVAGCLAVGMAIVVSARIAGPLDRLRRQAMAVTAGRLDAEVAPAATRELGELGRAFNAMTRQLRDSLAELEQAKIRLEAMLANLSDGVVIVDASGNVVTINPAAARLLGASEAEALGRSILVVSRDHQLAGLVANALTSGTSTSATVELGRGRRVVEAIAQPLLGSSERLGLLLLRDVTERRRLEGMRREFVANVSHELRTPISTIRLLVETLEAGAAHDPSLAGELFARTIAEADRLTALVEELLDLARIESGKEAMQVVPSDLGAMLREAAERLRPQAERAGLELRLELAPDLPPVLADPARAGQVVVNLVHNAIKFTPEGGAITVGATADADRATITIRDTGIGISPEERDRLFERFYKADKGRQSRGTGLGLAIAKHIVQAHGGAIGVESNPGEGATFWFTLPLARSGPDGRTQTTPASAGAANLV